MFIVKLIGTVHSMLVGPAVVYGHTLCWPNKRMHIHNMISAWMTLDLACVSCNYWMSNGVIKDGYNIDVIGQTVKSHDSQIPVVWGICRKLPSSLIGISCFAG